MRNDTTIRPWHYGLLLLVAFLLLALGGTRASAAPLLQATETPVPPTVTPTETALPPLPPNCAIEGYVFHDVNRDQVRQPGEPGLVTTVFLLPAEGPPNPLASRGTDGEGYFCFETGSVAPGRYRLRQEKVDGYETTGGQDRNITVNEGAVTEVLFPNIEIRPTATAAPTSTPEPTRTTPTPGPTFTSTPTPIPTATTTLTPEATLSPSVTPSPSTTVSPTGTSTMSPTPTVTSTATTTATPTPTSTLRALTPIATFITTTPGVLVTTTPFPGGPGGPSVPGGPIDRLPDTGSGNSLLLVASALGLLMVGAGLARRLFFSR